MLDNKHDSKSHIEFKDLLKKALRHQAKQQEHNLSAIKSLTEIGENVQVMSLTEAFQALMETADSIRFCSMRRARIRKLKQRVRFHQIRLEVNSWTIQYLQEKIERFESGK